MWKDLSMKEKAAMMKVAVKNGITDLYTIRDKFDEWYKTVPEDRNDTTNYNLRRAYELLPKEQLKKWRNATPEQLKSDEYHLNSVAPDGKGNYEFLKSKDHDSYNKELEWYNSNDAQEFRDNYRLDDSAKYPKYIRKNKFDRGGKIDKYIYPETTIEKNPWVDKYFKENPNVAGMAIGAGMNGVDGPREVIINPYSENINRESVLKNERLRHYMDETDYNPMVTNKQRESYKGTPYYNDTKNLGRTEVARYLTGDPSHRLNAEQQRSARNYYRSNANRFNKFEEGGEVNKSKEFLNNILNMSYQTMLANREAVRQAYESPTQIYTVPTKVYEHTTPSVPKVIEQQKIMEPKIQEAVDYKKPIIVANTNRDVNITPPYANTIYVPSEELINSLKASEGFKDHWYIDGNGYPTIGWGFKQTAELKKMYPNNMTREQADAYLMNTAIPERVKRFAKLTPNIGRFNAEQRDALFDYFYNIGEGNYTKGSPKLQKALRELNYKEIANNLDFGYYDTKNPGLRKRRDWERKAFQK